MFNHSAHPELYTLSLHDALPISAVGAADHGLLSTTAHENIPARCLSEACPSRNSHWPPSGWNTWRSEEHTSELQSRENLVCRLLLEKKKQHALQRQLRHEHAP